MATEELQTLKICRFCLAVDKLGSIYSRDARIQSTAPLPVQVLSCLSVEVSNNDGMPSWICTDCRIQFEHCYRFKSMCKRAETLLRQYPFTGVWPDALPKPKIPQERVPKSTITLSQAKIKAPEPQPNHPKPSTSVPMKILNSNPVASPEPPVPKRMKKEEMDDEAMNFLNKVNNNEELSMDDVQRLIAAGDNEDEFITEVEVAPVQSTKKPRVLNKSSIRILNKEAEIVLEPRLSKPQVKRDQDGNVAIVTEILDPNEPYELEADPLKSAEIVETDVFPCPHCERSFPLRQLRDIHLVNHNRERSFQCTFCDKSFFSKYDLQKHNVIHTGDRPFICTICQKAFTRATLLHRHEKVHTDIPKYICVYCEKAFICKDELDKHTQNHKKNRPHQCKVCNKSFAFKQGLERHEIVHSRDQPYPCQYCDQSFSTPSKLSRHLTAHAGNRPYPCKFCAKSYLLSHHLSRHMRSHKQGSTAFKCSKCDKVYCTRDELIYHSAVHATATLVCPLCKEVFTEVCHVTAHIKAHVEGDSYACEFCDLIFMSSERLQEHIDIEHADDMQAYHEDDKAQAKNEIADEKGDEFQQTLEEFFIDELDEANDTETLIKVERLVSNKPKILNQTIIPAGQQVNTNDYTNQPMSDIDSKVMVVNDADSAEDEQPSPKKLKFSKIGKIITPSTKIAKELNEEPRRKVPTKPTVVPASPPKVQIKIQKNEILVPSPEQAVKSKQPTINSMLKALPKGVSIRRNTPIAAATQPTTTGKSLLLTTTESQKQLAEKKKTQPQSPPQSAVPKQEKQQERVLRGRRSNEAVTSGGGNVNKQPVTVKNSPVTDSVSPITQQIMIGNKKMKVQKITLTKSEADAMAKDGRISYKDGNMILTKSKPKSNK